MTDQYCVFPQNYRLRPRRQVLARDCVEPQVDDTALHGLLSPPSRYARSPVTGYAGCSVRRNRLRLTERLSTLGLTNEHRGG